MRLSLNIFTGALCVVFCTAGFCMAQAPEAAPAAVPAPAQALPAATDPAPAPPDVPPARKPSAVVDSPGPAPAAGSSKLYVIGPLDVLYVRVWGNQNLTGMVNIGSDGMMSLPLIGAVKADGLTVEQLNDVIRTKLSDFINNPEVTTDVTRINSKKYFIMGEGANHPGEFPLIGRTTISEAISIAGGFRDFANPKKIYVLRGPKKFPFNYKDVIAGKHLEQDIPLENGDRIVIPE